MSEYNPLEDDGLPRDYVLEWALWEALSLMQDMLIGNNSRNERAVTMVKRWRENPDAYLKHPYWQKTADNLPPQA